MDNPLSMSYSRRALIAGLASMCANRRLMSSKNYQRPIELGNGIEVRDFRLFPGDEIMRFIVEIYNNTDAIIDTPAVGVHLPHMNNDENYGWAVAIAPVFYPGTSAGLLGVAPKALATDLDWDTPEWTLCGPLTTRSASLLDNSRLDVSSDQFQLDSQTLEIATSVTNLGDATISNLNVIGLVWDRSGRICGSTNSAQLLPLEPGATQIRSVYVGDTLSMRYAANPFHMIDSVVDLDVSVSVQPSVSFDAPECPAIMPWNR